MIKYLATLILLSTIIILHGARKALVIGNGNYQTQALNNPANDARLMERTLKQLGFQVWLQTDLDHRALTEAIDDFSANLQHTDEAVFFFSGHGVQADGTNYLIPVGKEIRSREDLPWDAYNCDRLVQKLQSAAISIVILDACRDNPYKGVRSSEKGLTQLNGKAGSQYIIYATENNKTAADGDGANSPFTQALAKNIGTPNEPIEFMMKAVTRDVRLATSGKQIPWTSGNLETEFSFNPQNRYALPDPASGDGPAESPRPQSPELEVIYLSGSVLINSEYPGEVLMDGESKGSIPENASVRLKSVSAGLHQVTIRGVEKTETQSVTVKADTEAKLSFRKERDPEDYSLVLSNVTLIGEVSKKGSTHQASAYRPSALDGDRAICVYHAPDTKYPESILRFVSYGGDLKLSEPKLMFPNEPKNMGKPTPYSDGSSVYTAGLYVSGGKDPLYFNHYDASSGAIKLLGTSRSWPTDAFSDIEPELLLKAGNGKAYLFCVWRYNGWSTEKEDLYLSSSGSGLANWSSWVKAEHFDGEGLVNEVNVAEGNDNALHLALGVTWGGQDKIAYYKFDMKSGKFTDRMILARGKHPSVFTNDSGSLCVSYLNQSGQLACRTATLGNALSWSVEAIVYDHPGGIYGASNADFNGPFDHERKYYVWCSPSSRIIFEWKGGNQWINRGSLASTLANHSFHDLKLYRMSGGDLHLIQCYKGSAENIYQTHLESYKISLNN